MSYQIINGDITKVAAEAIVNSANPAPICGGSTEALIYEAAGYDELLEARQEIGHLNLCEARYTPAFKLNAKYIIHVCAPRWKDGESGEEENLAACYRNALEEAYNLGCKSIAFPLLSTGVYHFPKDKAMLIATKAMEDFQRASADVGKSDRAAMDIKLVLYDAESLQVFQDLFSMAQEFVDDYYEPESSSEKMYCNCDVGSPRNYEVQELSDANPDGVEVCESIRLKEPALESPFSEDSFPTCHSAADMKKGLDDLFLKGGIGKTFSDVVIDIMNRKGLEKSQVQHDADIDRKLFSKILHKDYRTAKPTAIALAIGLKLNYQEAVEFLSFAGFALSPANKADVIVRFFMENRELFYRPDSNKDKYKVIFLNDFLMEFEQETLGSGRKL